MILGPSHHSIFFQPVFFFHTFGGQTSKRLFRNSQRLTSIPMKTSSCLRTSPTQCWMIRFRTLFPTRLVLLRTKNSSNRTFFSKTLQFFCRFIHNRKERLVTNVVRRPSTRKPFADLVNAKEVEDYSVAFVSRIVTEWTSVRR